MPVTRSDAPQPYVKWVRLDATTTNSFTRPVWHAAWASTGRTACGVRLVGSVRVEEGVQFPDDGYVMCGRCKRVFDA